MNWLLELLSGWPQGRFLPELWRALGSSDEPLSAVAADWLTQLAAPRSATEALRELLDRGAFDAAEYLLLAVNLGSAEHNEWQEQINLERSQARASMEVQLDYLLERSGSVTCPVPDLKARREEIIDLAIEDLAAAERRYRELADEIQRWEDQYRGELLAELARRRDELGKDPRVAAWQVRVERAVAAGHFDLARESLLGGPGGSVDVLWPALPPLLPFWPFKNFPARVVCSWLREGGEARVEFFNTWAPPDGDDPARDLADSLDAVLAPGAAETEARRFLDSLECVLRVPPQPARPVEPTPAGFRSLVRGLYHPAMPAFNPLRYPGGVPITLVTAEALSVAAPASPDPPLDTPLVFAETRVPLADGVAEIRPEDLFRLLPDPRHRKWHLLRFIGSQISLDDALGPAAVQPHGELVFAREADSAALRSGDHCICGVPGVGKTALLKRILLDLANDGWRAAYLDSGEFERLLLDGGRSASVDAGRLGSVLLAATARLAAPDGRDAAGLAVGIDRADELSPGTLELLAQRDRHLRLYVAGSPELWRRLATIPGCDLRHYELRPLPFDTIRRFAEEILDLHGLSWSGEDVLDRIAHAAGGRPAVLLLLMRELFSQLEQDGRTRRYPFTNHHLDNALRGDGFRDSTATVLFEPLRRDADLKCVLAACLLEAQESHGSDAGVAGSDVKVWLSVKGLDFGEAEVDQGLERLQDLGIVEGGDLPGQLFLARGTMGLLVHHFLNRPMAYLDAERHRRLEKQAAAHPRGA
jgi:hypothetical protein